jgi:hypothetical protein
MWWAVTPLAWYRHAERLKRSAELLWAPLDHSMNLSGPFSADELALWDHVYAFLLVAGAALEAIFKAAAIMAVAKHEGLAGIITAEPRRLQRWLLSHSTVAIGERANIELSDLERSQLDRFKKYVVWAGRYPVPKDLIEHRPNAVTTLDFQVSNVDRVWFERLYEKGLQGYRRHNAEWQRIEAERKAMNQ